MKDEHTRPFEGIRVIDATHVLAGPFATYQLALLGAEVIKVESPRDPDMARLHGQKAVHRDSGMSPGYLTQSSNKRCVAIDLKLADGRDVFRRLVETADVLVENYRPGALDALGLGYQSLKQINPSLIYCSMSAYGQTGPRRERTAFDQVIQAASGIMAQTGTPEVNPIKLGAPVMDYGTGLAGAFAISAALFQRDRTKLGQYIDLAMLDVAMIFMSSRITNYHLTGAKGSLAAYSYETASSSAYRASDGELVMLGATSNRQNQRLWYALGRPDMIASDFGQRLANRKNEADVIAKIFQEKSSREWEEYLSRAGVPAARVRPMTEALGDIAASDRSLTHLHEGCPGVEGDVVVPTAPFKFDHGGPKVDTPPERVGASTSAVLKDLGYSDGDIARLTATGAIGNGMDDATVSKSV